MKKISLLLFLFLGTSELSLNAANPPPPPPPPPLSGQDVPAVIALTTQELAPLAEAVTSLQSSLKTFQTEETTLSTKLDAFTNSDPQNPNRAQLANDLMQAVSSANGALMELQTDANLLYRKMNKLNPTLAALTTQMQIAQSTYYEETPITKEDEKVFEQEEAISQDELKTELKSGKITAATLQDQINKMKEAKNKILGDENKYTTNKTAQSQDRGLADVLSDAINRRWCVMNPDECESKTRQ